VSWYAELWPVAGWMVVATAEGERVKAEGEGVVAVAALVDPRWPADAPDIPLPLWLAAAGAGL